jgi:hypothetical protein
MNRMMKYTAVIAGLFFVLFGCGKDIVGPSTSAPIDDTPPPIDTTGSIIFYSSAQENIIRCDSIQVIVDGTTRGYITGFKTSQPLCDDSVGTVIVSGIPRGSHEVKLGSNCEQTGGLYWEMNVVVFAQQCTTIPVAN